MEKTMSYSQQYLDNVARSNPELALQMTEGTIEKPASFIEQWMSTDQGLLETKDATTEEVDALETWLHGR